MEATFNHYTELGFKAVLLKGYSAAYNVEKDYKTAKAPCHNGFMDASYIPPASEDIVKWCAAGGWIGWVVAPEYHIVDTEDNYVIKFIDFLCRKLEITPAVNITNRGRQYVFTTDVDLLGESEQFTTIGIPVTYRASGKNYVIQPPVNGRTWLNYERLANPPKLPDKLLPYDTSDPYQIGLCLSFVVGEAYLAGHLSGDTDLDMAYMAYLIEEGFDERQISDFFHLVFRDEYDARRTDAMYRRAKEKINDGEVVRGAGSFVHKVKEVDLKKVQRFIDELQRLKPGFGHGRKKTKFEPEPWTEPIPFDDVSMLPDFPVNVLPDIGCRIVSEIAEVTQVDPGLPGLVYLAVLSTCRAGDVVNLISHKEPCNLYLAATLPSGHRKTSVESEMSRPIYDYQLERQSALAEKIREATNKYRIMEGRLAKLYRQAASLDDAAERQKLVEAANIVSLEMSLNPIPATPIFICDDVTTERLGILMAENSERMAILSAEGGIFKLISGLYADREGNFDLYLKAHAGDPWSNHRVGRESQMMRRPSLTMGLAIQPDVLDEIGNNRHFRGRGLVARFLFSICKSQVGYRSRQTKPLKQSLVEEYQQHIYTLMDIPTGYEFTLTPEGQDTWDEFYNDIEKDMRPQGALEYIPDWGSKLPGAVARIAGLLHMATHGRAGIGKPISADIAAASCVIGSYFREHALVAFKQMREDPRIATARKILSFIKREKPQSFKSRDLFNHTNCQSMKEIEPAIGILLERGYIREIARDDMEIRRGRPEAMSYEVNPKLFSNV